MSSALIGTHSGSFHADEALGVWMLRRLDRFGGAGAKVVRSRDPEVQTLSHTHTYTYIRERIPCKSIPRKRIRKTPVRRKKPVRREAQPRAPNTRSASSNSCLRCRHEGADYQAEDSRVMRYERRPAGDIYIPTKTHAR